MKLLRCALASALLVLALLAPASATPSATQTVRCADLVAAVGAGSLTWSGSAQTCSNNNLIITRATFVSWISNTGSCAGGTGYIPTYGDMLNCKSGGTASQQTKSANFFGLSTATVSGVCYTTQSQVTTYTTGSAVAPTSSGTQVAWLGSSNNAAFTLQIKNPSGTVVQTYSVPANSGSTYPYSQTGAAAGVYTFVESGLSNSPGCPTAQVGGSANGTLSWYQ